MQEVSEQFLKEHLDILQVGVSTAAYTKCWSTWRDLDFIPDYNKLYFICDGEGWVKIGKKDYYPAAGQLLLAPAGMPQSYSVINGNPYTKYWCHFTARVGEINLFDLLEVPYLINITNTAEVSLLFDKLISSHDSTLLSARFEEKAALLNILGCYFENAASEIALIQSYHTSRFNEIVKYIHENLCTGISVKSLADAFHLHPNYFIKFFKKYTGASPIQYINKVRIEKAKLLLKSTSLSVTEISGKTGFNDLYHFSKSFKSYTGYSPTDFRNI